MRWLLICLTLGPYHVAEKVRYPPVFQAMGTEDEAFDISQALSFDEQLKRSGVESKLMVLEGLGHSFDIKAEVGSEIHLSVIVPAVNFAEASVGHGQGSS
jgi:acetyl esterase/lipase